MVHLKEIKYKAHMKNPYGDICYNLLKLCGMQFVVIGETFEEHNCVVFMATV